MHGRGEQGSLFFILHIGSIFSLSWNRNGVDTVLEGGQGLLNLTAPSASQASVSAHLQSLDPVISFKVALDAAVSVSIPALIKLAVKEATMPKPKARGKRACSPRPVSPLLRLLRTPSNPPPLKNHAKPNIWSIGPSISMPKPLKNVLPSTTRIHLPSHLQHLHLLLLI